ncbi:MAG: thioredoxin domain-containing protein [Gemmatimonadetes bacterium]|nr:thioredoxin domain-containing protein [Gemmatimonadota bacterium]MYB98510.1 thioredoxin domain-containing protein [Gemmatimonadota bacterium]MYI46528.1 thioredoxin domain-containing protein [Gemmatimonadota bacterium]
MTFCKLAFPFWIRKTPPAGGGPLPIACSRDRSQGIRDIRVLALALAFIASGCGGGSEDANADGSAGSAANGDQSALAGMLTEGGVTYRMEAQEVPLEELGFDYGSVTAPIKVVELSDYGCGYCRRFHTETFPTLLKDYIETGKVHWKYVTYVSGMFTNGLSAAFVAECAGEQGLFEPINDLLYQRQAEWKNLSDPFPVYDQLAEAVGADVEELNACIEEERPRERVRSGVVTGRNLGVRGTPAFVANGVPIMGAQPLEWWVEFFATIEEMIDGMEAGGGEPSGQAPPP